MTWDDQPESDGSGMLRAVAVLVLIVLAVAYAVWPRGAP